MKIHKILMAAMIFLGVVFIAFEPAWNIGSGFGLLLLICPIMMFGMMAMMRNNHKH